MNALLRELDDTSSTSDECRAGAIHRRPSADGMRWRLASPHLPAPSGHLKSAMLIVMPTKRKAVASQVSRNLIGVLALVDTSQAGPCAASVEEDTA